MRKLNPETRGYVLLLLGIGLWSTAEVVIRAIHTEIAPVQLAWVRFVIGGAFLLSIMPGDLKRREVRLDRRIVLHCVWLSLLGVVATGISFQFALKHAGAGIVAAVFGAAPMMVLVFSRLLLGDPMTLPRIAGVVMGFLGILVLSISHPSPTFSLFGFGLALFNAACFALFTVAVKKIAGPFAGSPVMALCCAFGALFITPLMLLENDWRALDHLPHLWLPVLYLSLGTTGLAYLFYYQGLEKVDATRAVSVILLKPPLAAFLAAVVLHEPVTWNLAGALVFILGGLYLVNIFNRYKLLRSASQ